MDDFDICVNSMFPMNVLTADFALPKVQICYEPFAFFYDMRFLINFKWYHRIFFRMVRHLYMYRDKHSLHKMDKVLTVNETNIPKFQAVYNMRPNVVYVALDTEMYHRAGQDDILAIRQQHPGQPILFHSTDLTGIKGSFKLLDVIAILKERYPKIKLLFTVYVNNPDGTQNFLQRIAELGLQNNCEFLGCLPKEQLPLYYSAVDFVCQPSLNQPGNWPLKEGLLCGTPIIGGVESEEVDEMVNGVRINVEAREEAAAKLDTLFQSQASLKVDFSELVEKYSLDACLGRFNRILEECCADYSRRV
jgi:glycosyltransferase involved in cell wall biosynthesis